MDHLNASCFDQLMENKSKRLRWAFTKADGDKANIHSLDTKFRRQLRRLDITNASLHTWDKPLQVT
jgi:hypothetical protein